MIEDSDASFSLEETQRFARRYGLKALNEQDMPALAKALQTSVEAGRAIPRMPSKFLAPAFAFDVPARIKAGRL